MSEQSRFFGTVNQNKTDIAQQVSRYTMCGEANTYELFWCLILFSAKIQRRNIPYELLTSHSLFIISFEWYVCDFFSFVVDLCGNWQK